MSYDPRLVVERRMQRLHGANPETRERMREYLEEQSDWFGWCRFCGEELSGTIQEIRKHRCPDEQTSR